MMLPYTTEKWYGPTTSDDNATELGDIGHHKVTGHWYIWQRLCICDWFDDDAHPISKQCSHQSANPEPPFGLYEDMRDLVDKVWPWKSRKTRLDYQKFSVRIHQWVTSPHFVEERKVLQMYARTPLRYPPPTIVHDRRAMSGSGLARTRGSIPCANCVHVASRLQEALHRQLTTDAASAEIERVQESLETDLAVSLNKQEQQLLEIERSEHRITELNIALQDAKSTVALSEQEVKGHRRTVSRLEAAVVTHTEDAASLQLELAKKQQELATFRERSARVEDLNVQHLHRVQDLSRAKGYAEAEIASLQCTLEIKESALAARDDRAQDLERQLSTWQHNTSRFENVLQQARRCIQTSEQSIRELKILVDDLRCRIAEKDAQNEAEQIVAQSLRRLLADTTARLASAEAALQLQKAETAALKDQVAKKHEIERLGGELDEQQESTHNVTHNEHQSDHRIEGLAKVLNEVDQQPEIMPSPLADRDSLLADVQESPSSSNGLLSSKSLTARPTTYHVNGEYYQHEHSEHYYPQPRFKSRFSHSYYSSSACPSASSQRHGPPGSSIMTQSCLSVDENSGESLAERRAELSRCL